MKNMKSTLMTRILPLAALVLTSTASAASTPDYIVSCEVITNGNGRSWETIATLEEAVKEFTAAKEYSLDVKSPYGGDTFTVTVFAAYNERRGVNFTLTQDVTVDKSSISLTDMDIGFEQKQPTGNFADTNSTFTLKSHNGKMVSYGVSCGIKK